MADSNIPGLGPVLDVRTRKTRSVIFGALRQVGQRPTAEGLGIAENTFSEWLKNYGDRISLFLTLIGLKAVPLDANCITTEQEQERQKHLASLQYWADIGWAAKKAERPVINLPDAEGDSLIDWSGQ